MNSKHATITISDSAWTELEEDFDLISWAVYSDVPIYVQEYGLTGWSSSMSISAEDADYYSTSARKIRLMSQSGSATLNYSLIGSSIFSAHYLDFNLTPNIEIAQGRLSWNETYSMLDLGLGNGVTMQVGQGLVRVRNPSAGDTITAGSVVYISGSTGAYPEIAIAKSDSDTTSKVLGITMENIISPGYGFVIISGYVTNIKTDYSGAGTWGTTWVEGDTLYVSKTDAGVLTNVEPAVSHHSDIVGMVGVVHTTEGSILVAINRHKTLEELSDVNGTALTTSGQIAIWDEDNKYFDFDYNILEPVWVDNDLAPGTIGHPSVSPPDSDDYQGFVFDLFDDGNEEQVFHIWHVPIDFVAGDASVRGHFGMMVSNPQGGSDEYVAIGFECTKISIGDVFDSTIPDGGNSVDVKIVDGEAAYTWHKSPEGACVTTGWAVGDLILFRFFRDVNGTYSANDDYTGDAWIGIYHLEYLSLPTK